MTTISWRQSENKNKRRSGSLASIDFFSAVFLAFSFSRVSAHTETVASYSKNNNSDSRLQLDYRVERINARR